MVQRGRRYLLKLNDEQISIIKKIENYGKDYWY